MADRVQVGAGEAPAHLRRGGAPELDLALASRGRERDRRGRPRSSTSSWRGILSGARSVWSRVMGEAAWRRRFRAPRIGLPLWARDRPDRLLYGSNASGKWELYAWNRERDTHRQVTDRPEGTMWGRLDPSGEWIWWFDDAKGNE